MLTIHQISKSYGMETVLDAVSFQVNAGERFGLVGPNGCGKSTLLRIITGQEQADSGSVQLTPASLRVGYLEQGHAFAPGETVASYLERMEGDPTALSQRLEKLALELVADPDQPGLQAEYDAILSRLEIASEGSGRGLAVLAGLGLGSVTPEMPAAQLSGGQKTRLSLAGVLLSNPQLLLLDEPTNHLDFDMLEWLEDWLLHSTAGLLVVSHDRTFLDHTVDGILDLDPLTHSIHEYEGNYSDYLEQKAGERERQWQEYYDQQDEISRLKGAARHMRGIAQFRKGGKADTGDKFAKGFFANRSLGTVRRAKGIEQRIEHLLTDERVEKPGRTWQMKIEFGDTPASGRDVLALDDLCIGYPDKPLLNHLDAVLRFGSHLALVGPNGCGKTTLLRTIAGLLPPLAGRVRLGSNVSVGYMAQEQETLPGDQNALEIIRCEASLSETEVRSFLSKFLFKGDDVFVPAGRLSYGERARLSLASLVGRGCNLLLLDEPINHLDIPSRSRFEEALAGFEGTIVVVAHDRYFIQQFANEIWEIRDGILNLHGSILV